MRNAARLALVLVLLVAGAALVLPTSHVLTPAARAGQLQNPLPSPTLPDPGDILPKPPQPDPPPEPEPDPAPAPPPDGGGGGGGVTGGGGSSEGGATGGTGGATGGSAGGVTTPAPGPRTAPRSSQNGGHEPPSTPPIGAAAYTGNAPIGGSFTTDKLVAIATRLKSLGWSEGRIVSKVFRPFIIGGPAGWTDTWHAPRYGPAPGEIRQHEGQDVFCNYGDPVLATETGTVEFDNQSLGGRVARLHRSDGSYWYYAHLSGYNGALSSGDTVHAGDVIAYCGNTGNAITSPPHVHFGWYMPSGAARNPMKPLISWLHAAERRAGVLEGRTTGKRVRTIQTITAARRFGDTFMPDRSVFESRSESALAASANPAFGAFGLAAAALRSVVSETFTQEGFAPPTEVSAHSRGAGVGSLLNTGPRSRPESRHQGRAESGD